MVHVESDDAGIDRTLDEYGFKALARNRLQLLHLPFPSCSNSDSNSLRMYEDQRSAQSTEMETGQKTFNGLTPALKM